MANAPEKKTAPAALPNLSLLMLRLMVIMLVLVFVSLLLGVAFALIAQGLIHGFIWLGMYWKPAGNILTKITKNAFPLPVASIRKIAWYTAIILIVKIAIAVALVAVGLQMLFQRGFCWQNLICLALTR